MNLVEDFKEQFKALERERPPFFLVQYTNGRFHGPGLKSTTTKLIEASSWINRDDLRKGMENYRPPGIYQTMKYQIIIKYKHYCDLSRKDKDCHDCGGFHLHPGNCGEIPDVSHKTTD